MFTHRSSKRQTLFMVLLNSVFSEPLYFAVPGLAFDFPANSLLRRGLAPWGLLSLALERKSGMLILPVLYAVTHLLLPSAQVYPFFHKRLSLPYYP